MAIRFKAVSTADVTKMSLPKLKVAFEALMSPDAPFLASDTLGFKRAVQIAEEVEDRCSQTDRRDEYRTDCRIEAGKMMARLSARRDADDERRAEDVSDWSARVSRPVCVDCKASFVRQFEDESLCADCISLTSAKRTASMYDGDIADIAADLPIVPEWINAGLRQMTEREQFEQANSELALTNGELDAMFPTVGDDAPNRIAQHHADGANAPYCQSSSIYAGHTFIPSSNPLICDVCSQTPTHFPTVGTSETVPVPVTFPRSFGDRSGYVCDGDTIEVSVEGFDIVATVVRDDSSDAPDERQDGFWPSDDPKDAGYIGDGYKLTEDELSESFEFVDHGVEGSQYFQGCGTIGSYFDEVSTGIGSSYREALNDAFEQACTSDDFHQSQIDAIETAIAAESDTPTVTEGAADEDSEVWHHASIRYNLASPILKAKAQAQTIMDAWKNDEWWYVGVSLSISRNGIMLDSHAASVWGIECNYPTANGKMNNSYLTETANELLDEALDAGRAAMVLLNG